MTTNTEKFKQLEISGNYRGVVLDNTGGKGKCKIFVPAVFPDEYSNDPKSLPWAEPAMPIDGGYRTLPSYRKNEDTTRRSMYFVNGGVSLGKTSRLVKDSIYNFETGTNKVPKKGAHVWVFFEGNNPNYPVYWAVIQGGAGWFAENEYQSVYKSDNVFIRIDDHPNLIDKKLETDTADYAGGDPVKYDTDLMDITKPPAFTSSSFFDSLNANNIQAVTTKPTVNTKMPTRIELEVTGNVQLIIKGNANVQVQGNTYMETCGNFYETTIGDKYEKVKGNYYLEVDKDFKELITGNHEETVVQKVTENYKTTQTTNVKTSISINTPVIYISKDVRIANKLVVNNMIYSPTIDANVTHTNVVNATSVAGVAVTMGGMIVMTSPAPGPVPLLVPVIPTIIL